MKKCEGKEILQLFNDEKMWWIIKGEYSQEQLNCIPDIEWTDRNFCFFSLTFDISPSWPSSLAIMLCVVALNTLAVLSADAVSKYWPVKSNATSSTSSSWPRSVPMFWPAGENNQTRNQLLYNVFVYIHVLNVKTFKEETVIFTIYIYKCIFLVKMLWFEVRIHFSWAK